MFQIPYQNDQFSYIGNNTLLYSYALEVTTYCPMKFEHYPLDNQTCYFMLGTMEPFQNSHQHFVLDVLYFDSSKQVTQLDYYVQVHRLVKSQTKYLNCNHCSHLSLQHIQRYGCDTCKNVTWQRTGFEIILERKFQKYVINYYIPSGSLVVLSWVITMQSGST